MKAGWHTTNLGDLCDVLDHKRKPVTKKDRIAGEFPYYGATGVLDFVSDYIFDEPLVLVGEDGAKWGAGERTAFLVEGKCWVNNHAHVLRPNRKVVLDDWLVYYLNHSDLSGFVSGLTVPKLNQGSLREIPVPVPPIPDQQCIVGILDKAFEAVDTAKTNAERNLQNTRALFDSRLRAVFTQGDSAHEARQLEDVCEITVGHVGPMAKQYRNSGIPFLRSQNIRPFHVSLDNVVFIDEAFHRSLAKSALQPGDVAVVRTGYPGTAAVIPKSIPVCNCSDLVIVRPGPAVDPDYLALFFNSAHGKELVAGRVVGAAQKHFNITAAKQVVISLPSIGEQRQVVAELERLAFETKRLESTYQRKLGALDELKKSLLHRAFSGELTEQFVEEAVP